MSKNEAVQRLKEIIAQDRRATKEAEAKKSA